MNGPSRKFELVGIGNFTGTHEPEALRFDATTRRLEISRLDDATASSRRELDGMDHGWTPRGIGDIDGDHRDEIVWIHDDGRVAISKMRFEGGTLRGSTRLLGFAGRDWMLAGVGDLDGDGIDDLVWIHPPSGSVCAWMLSASGIASVAAIGSVTHGWSVQKVADFDGDGKADIFWRLGSANVIWYLDGPRIALVDLLPSVDPSWTVCRSCAQDKTSTDILWKHATGTRYRWQMRGRGVPPAVLAVTEDASV